MIGNKSILDCREEDDESSAVAKRRSSSFVAEYGRGHCITNAGRIQEFGRKTAFMIRPFVSNMVEEIKKSGFYSYPVHKLSKSSRIPPGFIQVKDAVGSATAVSAMKPGNVAHFNKYKHLFTNDENYAYDQTMLHRTSRETISAYRLNITLAGCYGLMKASSTFHTVSAIIDRILGDMDRQREVEAPSVNVETNVREKNKIEIMTPVVGTSAASAKMSTRVSPSTALSLSTSERKRKIAEAESELEKINSNFTNKGGLEKEDDIRDNFHGHEHDSRPEVGNPTPSSSQHKREQRPSTTYSLTQKNTVAAAVQLSRFEYSEYDCESLSYHEDARHGGSPVVQIVKGHIPTKQYVLYRQNEITYAYNPDDVIELSEWESFLRYAYVNHFISNKFMVALLNFLGIFGKNEYADMIDPVMTMNTIIKYALHHLVYTGLLHDLYYLARKMIQDKKMSEISAENGEGQREFKRNTGLSAPTADINNETIFKTCDSGGISITDSTRKYADLEKTFSIDKLCVSLYHYFPDLAIPNVYLHYYNFVELNYMVSLLGEFMTAKGGDEDVLLVLWSFLGQLAATLYASKESNNKDIPCDVHSLFYYYVTYEKPLVHIEDELINDTQLPPPPLAAASAPSSSTAGEKKGKKRKRQTKEQMGDNEGDDEQVQPKLPLCDEGDQRDKASKEGRKGRTETDGINGGAGSSSKSKREIVDPTFVNFLCKVFWKPYKFAEKEIYIYNGKRHEIIQTAAFQYAQSSLHRISYAASDFTLNTAFPKLYYTNISTVESSGVLTHNTILKVKEHTYGCLRGRLVREYLKGMQRHRYDRVMYNGMVDILNALTPHSIEQELSFMNILLCNPVCSVSYECNSNVQKHFQEHDLWLSLSCVDYKKMAATYVSPNLDKESSKRYAIGKLTAFFKWLTTETLSSGSPHFRAIAKLFIWILDSLSELIKSGYLNKRTLDVATILNIYFRFAKSGQIGMMKFVQEAADIATGNKQKNKRKSEEGRDDLVLAPKRQKLRIFQSSSGGGIGNSNDGEDDDPINYEHWVASRMKDGEECDDDRKSNMTDDQRVVMAQAETFVYNVESCSFDTCAISLSNKHQTLQLLSATRTATTSTAYNREEQSCEFDSLATNPSSSSSVKSDLCNLVLFQEDDSSRGVSNDNNLLCNYDVRKADIKQMQISKEGRKFLRKLRSSSHNKLVDTLYDPYSPTLAPRRDDDANRKFLPAARKDEDRFRTHVLKTLHDIFDEPSLRLLTISAFILTTHFIKRFYSKGPEQESDVEFIMLPSSLLKYLKEHRFYMIRGLWDIAQLSFDKSCYTGVKNELRFTSIEMAMTWPYYLTNN
ncbi:hypothetical protein GE061_011694 [Apolygus lucorum]|uniref:C2H2-type domain-containing protein n=1 Tax=Apolygus lucorum TaxID=248454 RepID=A0A8S9Y0V5_APOLU|nr:hypothetical protein GE061_011694 [Apolygus lucorum]